jgi:hypothetical protein
MKACLIALCLVCSLSTTVPLSGSAPAAAGEKDYPMLAKPGQKVPLEGDFYFVYGFTKAPKLGTAIMKVEVFRKDGQRDTSFTVKGDVDMPSMRGAHATGEKAFQVSAKGFYLLPVPLVMPGDWEFRFSFWKNGKTVLRGAYLFDL